MEESDVVVTTGGVSMGSRDLVPQTLAALGFETVFLAGVQVQPGKPVLVARRADGALFVGLPGNPVSVLATAHLFLFPAMAELLAGWRPRLIEVPMAQDFEHGGRRHLFLPARLGDGGLVPMRWNGSGDLIAAAAADGLVDPGGGPLPSGRDRARFPPAPRPRHRRAGSSLRARSARKHDRLFHRSNRHRHRLRPRQPGRA